MIARCCCPVSVVFSESISEVLILYGSPRQSFLIPRIPRNHISSDDSDIRFFLFEDIPNEPHVIEIIGLILAKVNIGKLNHFEFSIFIKPQLLVSGPSYSEEG